MNKFNPMSCSALLLFFATLVAPNFLFAATFFADDFEGPDGIKSGPSPVLSWQAPYAAASKPFGMMLGEDDIYSISTTVVNSGKRSLRINFNGRNDFCNICGAVTHRITASDLSGGCLPVSGAEWEDYVYNKTDGFSRWSVNSANSSQVCVNLNAPLDRPISGGQGSIGLGDEIKVPRKCGVSGRIGGNSNRKSDCDLAINYLEGIEKRYFDYGDTLSRRMYVYIPSATQIPSITIKLGYAKFERSNIVPFVSSMRGGRFEIDGNSILGFIQTDLFFERNRWMYIEEVYTRETSSGASDGRFALYAGFRDENKSKPVFTANNLTFGDIKQLSIIGNWPHVNYASGYMYIDDVAISDAYIGPVEGKVASRPLPPKGLTVSSPQK